VPLGAGAVGRGGTVFAALLGAGVLFDALVVDALVVDAVAADAVVAEVVVLGGADVVFAEALGAVREPGAVGCRGTGVAVRDRIRSSVARFWRSRRTSGTLRQPSHHLRPTVGRWCAAPPRQPRQPPHRPTAPPSVSDTPSPLRVSVHTHPAARQP